MRLLAAASVVLAAAASVVRADVFIDTTPAWGTQGFCCFGIPNTQTYGQTVSVPLNGNSVLESFTFYMKIPNTLAIRGEVYAWDGTRAVGHNLFESPVVNGFGTGSWYTYEFDTGGLALIPGGQYVLFATTSKDNGGHSGWGPWGLTTTNPYTGGALVYQNNGTDTSRWTSEMWATLPPQYDLAFKAHFSPATVPEPSTWVLLATVAGGAALVRRRRAHER
jgi:hypothetical protein